MLKAVVAIVQQIMKEFNSAVLEQAKIVASIKVVLNLRAKRPLDFIGMICCTQTELTEVWYTDSWS
jgi:hypothetical protein